jgi:hypothetical protein
LYYGLGKETLPQKNSIPGKDIPFETCWLVPCLAITTKPVYPGLTDVEWFFPCLKVIWKMWEQNKKTESEVLYEYS